MQAVDLDDTETTHAALDDVAEQVDEIRTELREELERAEAYVQDAIRERPLAALAVAVAGGYLLARLLRR